MNKIMIRLIGKVWLLLLITSVVLPLSATELHDAVTRGDEKVLIVFLEKNPQLIDEQDNGGNTALHVAVKKNNLKMVEILLDYKANINSVDNEGNTPLHWAAYTKSYEIAELLLKHKADVTIKNASQFTPVFFAVMTDNLKMVELFSENGADLNTTGFFNGTLLHYAASTGSPELIKFLLDHGLDVKARSVNKETPLQWAMYRNNVKVINILVDNGALINHVFDIWGNTAMTAALLSNSLECIQALIKKGADVNEKNADGRTPLHTAVSPANERINLLMVQALIDNGADVNALKNDGVSVLSWAVKYGNKEIVRLLLDKGARVEPLTDKNGRIKYSILHNALCAGNDQIIEMILETTKNIDFKDITGKTPLFVAVEMGKKEVVEKLIARKANIQTIDDNYGMTALHRAAIKGYDDIANYLITAGVDINARDKENNTALFYAAKYGHKKLHDFLLSKGAKTQTNVTFADNLLLTKKIEQKQAAIWYLGHSGWAVKTENNLLIFDYYDNARDPIDVSIVNGHIVPEELKNMTVTVFVSYLCADHFDPKIYEWGKTVKKCTLVYGFDPNKITKYVGPAYQQMGLNQTKTINGIEITTLLANVGGAGYLVSVDGITIFHPGDHSERERDHSGPYCGEIDFIAKKNRAVDIAFFPVQGDYLANTDIVKLGTYYSIEKLSPSVVFPMHAGEIESVYDLFIGQAKNKFPNVQFIGAKNRGDHYFYDKKKVK